MLLCAQYVLPITSEPIHNGAVLVRDGAIRDVGDAAMLKLRYPDEEVSDFGQAAILPWRTRSCAASSTMSPTQPGS